MIEFRTLGTIALTGPGERELRSVLVGPKRLALLIYLSLASPRGFQRKDTLLALFWPEYGEKQARRALRQALYVLRRSLGERVITSRGDGELGVDREALWCDAAAFEELVQVGEPERALELYRGELLPGFYVGEAPEFERWLEEARARLRRKAAQAAWVLAERKEAASETVAAGHWARRAIGLAPDDEGETRRLIELLNRVGDRTGAVQAYEEFARRLREEYKLEPAPETQALIAAVRARQRPAQVLGRGGTGAGPATVRRSPRSVAVLPFLNLGVDADSDYFADGVTEDVITQLSKVRALKVISHSSVMPFKKREQSPREIGARLGVATLLEGSVRRAGSRVRIVAQLINAETDEHLWADTYDRELTDIFAIQSDVALHIAAALKAELSPDDKTRIGKEPTSDLEAYQLYLKGRHCCFRFTEEGFRRALDYFEKAIGKDPKYAPAYWGAALTYLALGFGHGAGALRPDHAYSGAKEAVAKALALDAGLGEAHGTLAFLKFTFEFDWTGAEQEFERAIELNPGSADTYDAYGLMLSALQRYDEAIAAQRHAQDLDPLGPVRSSDLASALLRAGEYDDALQEAKQLIELEPGFPMGHSTLGWAYLKKGLQHEGLVELETAVSLSPGNTIFLAQLGQAYALAGRIEHAQAVLQQLDELSRHRYVSPYHMAYIYTGLGEQDKAIDWLERAYEERAGGVYGVKGSFLFTTLRSHPRFTALLRKMNLA